MLQNPAPNPLVISFAESAIELELRFWIADAQNGVHNVMSEVLLEIWRLFRDHGIRIPYPKRDVFVHGVKADAVPSLVAVMDDRAAESEPDEFPPRRQARGT